MRAGCPFLKRLARLSGQLADACLERNDVAFHRRNTEICFQIHNECRSVDRVVAACLIRKDPDLFLGLVPQSSVGLMSKSCISVLRCLRLCMVPSLGAFTDPDTFACFLVCALSPPRLGHNGSTVLGTVLFEVAHLSQ